MAVNVSVRQFERTDLAATVAGVLAETGMPPACLVLEMTESVLLSDTEENLGQLLRLKALGVALAMDDFGTGYSSLAYLGRFPMDTLKIDREFVRGIETPNGRLIFEAVIALANELGLVTVAEGIETPRQVAVVRASGCTLAQGYHFARPLPAQELAARLAAVPVPAPRRPPVRQTP